MHYAAWEEESLSAEEKRQNSLVDNSVAGNSEENQRQAGRRNYQRVSYGFSHGEIKREPIIFRVTEALGDQKIKRSVWCFFKLF